MTSSRRFWLVCSVVLLVGFAFRCALARYLSIPEPEDSKVYSQLARNLITQEVYSHASEPPYTPSLIRMPGYPLFLAGVYRFFGFTNDGAVYLIQGSLDAATCALLAIIAFYWEPDSSRKRIAALAALTLAAICPFSAIYTRIILTETPTIFLAVAMSLTATLAFRSVTAKRSLLFWLAAGVIAGVAVQFRPDNGLFVAAIGLTLVGEMLRGQEIETVAEEETETVETEGIETVEAEATAAVEAEQTETLEGEETETVETERHSGIRGQLARVAILVAVFIAAFCAVLAPWTIRNSHVFDIFQPLAPRYARMPGEFVPSGYFSWLRTWMQDQRYIGPALLKLDQAPIDVDEFPDEAFDSLEEKKQVAALLEKYNYPAGAIPEQTASSDSRAKPFERNLQPHTPRAEPVEDEFELHDQENLPDKQPSIGVEQPQLEQSQDVKMTPEIDAGFGRIARERISHSPLRYYLSLPFRRAVSLWFDTHSQYYPFEGELMPLDELDKSTNQHIWLPLFAALTWIYTLLGVAGAWLLWRTRDFVSRRWVVLVGLIVFLRLSFFATLENPEPRYVVEIFPFLSVLGGIAAARIATLRIRDWYKGKGVRVQ